MSLIESVMQQSSAEYVDPLSVVVEKLQSRKLHWWNIMGVSKLLIKIFFMQNNRVKILEMQMSLQAEAMQNMVNVVTLQQKQIQLISEGLKND